MITSRNRSADLLRTIQIIQKLDPAPGEILITADGCADDSVDVVKRTLPEAKLFVNEIGQGSVASRDRMLQAATSDLILSLDDDSYPEQRDSVARICEVFRERPRTSVAHFPQRTDEYPESLNKVDFGAARLTGAFANSGACFQRAIYAQLGGFCHRFFHTYEEPDYALQSIAAGYDILYTPCITIRHHFTPVERSEIRNHQRHARNEFWSAWMRCPFPFVLIVSLYRVFSQSRYAASRGLGWMMREPQWWWAAAKGMPGVLKTRQPLAWAKYWRWLRLLRRPQPVR